jgi:hypothetical protein
MIAVHRKDAILRVAVPLAQHGVPRFGECLPDNVFEQM